MISSRGINLEKKKEKKEKRKEKKRKRKGKKISVSENVDTFITENVSSFQGHDHNRGRGQKGNNKGRAISM